MQDLTQIQFDDSSTSYIDVSKEFNDFLDFKGRDLILSTVDFHYVGFYKPFRQLYFDNPVKNTVVDLVMSYEYWNGSAWVTLPKIIDNTNALSQSGFVYWSFPEDNKISDLWKENAIDGVTNYWIRIKTDNPISGTCDGINIVYCDDTQLKAEVRNIQDYLYTDRLGVTDASFINYHVAARDDIVQTLRNGGDAVETINYKRNLSKWDLLEIGEVKQAAKYLTLSKIFLDNSLNVDDKNYQRYREYLGKYGEAFKLYFMSIDKSDTGENTNDQKMDLNTIEIVRV